ncbi:hypothetical protein [Inquilinus sp. OTU3971]|uniref:hypothetical protein n=1 Tax=Inquilinus sp. OTU3971 TaxID=3043855 RepID=UPI00313EEC0F
MQRVLADTSVKVAVSLVGEAGPLVPMAIRFRLADESGAVIYPEVAIGDPGPGVGFEILTDVDSERVIFTIPAPAHQLAGKLNSLRVLTVLVATAEGTTRLVERYVVTKEAILEPLKNSVQTYDEAVLLSLSMPGMIGWEAANDTERQSALIAAFVRLAQLKYRVRDRFINGIDVQRRLALEPGSSYNIDRLELLTADEWSRLSGRFKESLARAQIAEADVILGGDEIGSQRQAGLFSHSIGEAKYMFRSEKPLSLPVSEQAVRHLRGFVRWSVTIGRA